MTPKLGDTQPTARTRPRPAGRRPSDFAIPAGTSPARRPPRILTGCLILGYLGALVVIGLVAHWVARDLAEAWSLTGIRPFQTTGYVPPGATPPPGVTPAEIPEAVPDPWTGEERVTILLLGLDYRDWIGGTGPPRTDSMILITIDPLTQRGGLLSIPRDLWVEVPGFGHNRINTAYPNGEASRLPGGGPGLAMQTVEDVIGVPIQFYAVVDFATFERLIDEIGGIDVLVHEPIRIAPIGRPSMQLEAKPYHFDGAEALAYARTRSGTEGDFGRARRQQQVALAILDRVLEPEILARLVTRAPSLYAELQSGIRTNMTLEQMIQLGWLAIQIPQDSYDRGVIGPPSLVGFYNLPDGAAVLRPVPDQIRLLRDQIFTQTSAFGPDYTSP
jgi:LCP family protein required for cell wall assembly